MSDLTDRLRARLTVRPEDYYEIVAALEKQAAEIERRVVVEREMQAATAKELARRAQEIERRDAEIERLRAGLEKILAEDGSIPTYQDLLRIVRAALERKP
jgi:hypothetical protein